MGKKRRDGRASKRSNDGEPHGNGKLEWENEEVEAEILEIRYEQGLCNRGTVRYVDGDVYEGDLKDDKRHGRGVLRYADGDVYDGEWRDGKLHGKGAFTEKNGDVYDGNWVDGNKLGPGTFRWENGDVYEGEFIRGLQHGRGAMSWKASGRRFQGQWVEGKRHGKGTMKLPSGDAYEQVWSNGQHVKGWANGMIGDWAGRLSPSSNATAVVPSITQTNGAATIAGRELSDGRQLRSLRSQERRTEAAKKKCEHCGVDDHRYKLRVCSGCDLALYCSAACQKAASRSHRRICDIASILPSRESDGLVLTYDQKKMVDFDAGLRYGTKYMGNLKHLQMDVTEMASGDTLRLSTKQISSLLKSKKGALDSVFFLSDGRHPKIHGIVEASSVWNEVHGLKRLRLDRMRFNGVQHICDIIGQQEDTLEVLCLPWLQIDWSRAKCRRAMVEAITACKQLVKLDLTGCVLMDSDLKVMLGDLPGLRILYLARATDHSHEFTDNTCGLIARKCPGLQEFDLRTHNHLSARGVRKIFEGCPHLRSISTSTPKLSCKDVRGLLDTAPQLMYLCLGDEVGFSAGELDELIEATGGRTVLRFGLGVDAVYVPTEEGVPAETREKYEHQRCVVNKIWGRWSDPGVANEWAGIFEGDSN